MCSYYLNTIGKLFEKYTSLRVSEKAKKELKKILEEKVVELTKRAQIYAEHAGRKTIKQEDIELALHP